MTKLSISNILCDKVHEVRYLHGNTMTIRVRTLIANYNYKREKIELSPQYCCCKTYCAKLQPESNWNIILLKTPIAYCQWIILILINKLSNKKNQENWKYLERKRLTFYLHVSAQWMAPQNHYSKLPSQFTCKKQTTFKHELF